MWDKTTYIYRSKTIKFTYRYTLLNNFSMILHLPPQFSPNFAPSWLCFTRHEPRNTPLKRTSSKVMMLYQRYLLFLGGPLLMPTTNTGMLQNVLLQSHSTAPASHFLSVIMSMALQIKRLMTVCQTGKRSHEGSDEYFKQGKAEVSTWQNHFKLELLNHGAEGRSKKYMEIGPY